MPRAAMALMLLLLIGSGVAGAGDAVPLPPWEPPDPATLPDDSFGRTVRYGHDLIANTAMLIGPDAADPARRYAGNGLDCQSCHLHAGTRRFGLPLAGVWGVFPTFIAREDEVRTLAQLIDGCMERSLNGRALPPAGPEMTAMLAYVRFISGTAPAGAPPVGRGVPPLALPGRAADPVHGAALYQEHCAHCHQQDGQGARLSAADAADNRRRYRFPPLWGPDSYNDGAGMARPITAARFIRANMPFGTDFANPVVEIADAFDIAVFIDQQPRPHLAGSEKDYPNRALKPPDATYPPFVGPFPPEQHRVGPWGPIAQWQAAHAASLRAAVTGGEAPSP